LKLATIIPEPELGATEGGKKQSDLKWGVQLKEGAKIFVTGLKGE